ncbi:MAG: hypothetical protein MJB14_16350 [Spirochaetes bacterium]|nr:hypothetical protein [Spirochaetota bacterium]
MRDYNLKKDLKQFSFIMLTVFFIVIAFLLFALIILFPIYYLSNQYPDIYSMVVLVLILGIIGILMFKRLSKIYQKYPSASCFFLHILIYILFPLFLIVFFLLGEAIVFNLFFSRFSMIKAILLIVAVNITFIFFYLLVIHKWIYQIKKKLKAREK